ncbi:MAG: four helix bundle protein [Proteobacteria bacterium]|nr:four helix bundle protein [Pseudomonadota bacterium]
MKIWQTSMELAKVIYQETDSFPAKETYGIISQMRRSAVSVTSNIAEGFMRRYNKEYKQFLYIALGSLAELETQVLLSEELGFLKKDKNRDIQADINAINKMITGLIKCL